MNTSLPYFVDWRDTLPNALTEDWIAYDCSDPISCYRLIDGRDVRFHQGKPLLFENGLWQSPIEDFPLDRIFLDTLRKMQAAGVRFKNQFYTLTGPNITSSRNLTNPYGLTKSVLIESHRFRLFDYDTGAIQDYLCENNAAGILCVNGLSESVVFNETFSQPANILPS